MAEASAAPLTCNACSVTSAEVRHCAQCELGWTHASARPTPASCHATNKSARGHSCGPGPAVAFALTRAGRSAAYCSRACQKAAWPAHKRACVPPEVAAARRQAAAATAAPCAARVGQQAVHVLGFSAEARTLTAEQVASMPRWRKCPVAHLLGIPLALKQLGPGRREPSNQCLATFMLVSPTTGMAPTDVQVQAVGPVLLACTDGHDLTREEVVRTGCARAHKGRGLACLHAPSDRPLSGRVQSRGLGPAAEAVAATA